MTADELKQKIEQCERDEESIRLNREDLEKQLKEIGESENLEPGDAVVYTNGVTKFLRFIVRSPNGTIFAIDRRGIPVCDKEEFKMYGYQKVGRIREFINPKGFEI